MKPKEVCVPKFTVKIEGNAVEEGARVFFEGIVDAQPPPGKNYTTGIGDIIYYSNFIIFY